MGNFGTYSNNSQKLTRNMMSDLEKKDIRAISFIGYSDLAEIENEGVNTMKLVDILDEPANLQLGEEIKKKSEEQAKEVELFKNEINTRNGFPEVYIYIYIYILGKK